MVSEMVDFSSSNVFYETPRISLVLTCRSGVTSILGKETLDWGCIIIFQKKICDAIKTRLGFVIPYRTTTVLIL